MAIEIESRVFFKTSLAAQHPTTDVFVDAGYTLTGGGAFLSYQEPGNLLTQCHPLQAPDSSWSGWRVYGKDCWLMSRATITAYAIGIRVTRNGKPVHLDQTVFVANGTKAELPNTPDHDGWVGVGGGAACDQNIYENVILASSAPPSTTEEQKGNGLLCWNSKLIYCCSPTSHRGPTGGGNIRTYLVAIRADGVCFATKTLHQKSTRASRPEAEVLAAEGVVVSGGAMNNLVQLSFNETSINMLTATQPVFGDDPGHITGWKAIGKDHQCPSPSIIQASVVTLSATKAINQAPHFPKLIKSARPPAPRQETKDNAAPNPKP